MAKGWTNVRRCPICDGSGWGKQRCRGFLHSDGSAVFCERPDLYGDFRGYLRSDTTISPFGIELVCFRKVL